MNRKQSLRILVVNYEYPPLGGGGGYICKNVVDELAGIGHKITVISSKYKDLQTFERTGNVAIHRVPVMMRTRQDVATLPSLLSFVPACIKKALPLMKRRQFDLINTHFAVPSGPAGQYLSAVSGLPNVLSIYGGDVYDPTKLISPHRIPVLKQVVKYMLNSADAVVSDSNDIKHHARKRYGVHRPIEIIPPGVAPYRGRKLSRLELGLPEDKILMTTLGRLVPRKNNAELVEIFSMLPNRKACHLVIMGEGPDRETIERKIEQLGVKESVTLLGRVGEEKFDILAASDIYVSSATHEGFGLVFLEAMVTGLPVVCYDNGGQVDFLIENKTGHICHLGDKPQFRDRLNALATSDKKRQEMQAYVRQYIPAFYINKCAESYVDVFQKALVCPH
jgi:glycosyltransferase involved in cell wall biosynthesis